MEYFILDCLLLGLLSLLSTLGTDSVVAGDALRLTEGSVGVKVNKLRGKLDGLFDLGGGNGREVGSGQLDVLNGALLDTLDSRAGDDDELALVSRKTLGVGLESFNGLVATAMVDRDAELAGDLAADASLLQLNKGESLAGTNLAVVLERGAVHNGSHETSGGGGSSSGFLGAGHASALLGASLVEPGHDALLPVLAEVAVRDYVVVLHMDG